MGAQPQPDRASLSADTVFRLQTTRLSRVAGRPRALAPKWSRAALSLVPQSEQPKPSDQPATPKEETR